MEQLVVCGWVTVGGGCPNRDGFVPKKFIDFSAWRQLPDGQFGLLGCGGLLTGGVPLKERIKTRDEIMCLPGMIYSSARHPEGFQRRDVFGEWETVPWTEVESRPLMPAVDTCQEFTA